MTTRQIQQNILKYLKKLNDQMACPVHYVKNYKGKVFN